MLLHAREDGQGVVQALDKKTGAVKWERPLPKSGRANATPILIPVNGKPALIVPSQGVLEAIDPADGSPVWSSTS